MMEQNSLAPLTVVIPTYNRREVLRRTLNGYLAQSSPHLVSELLIVDDGSTDDTESVVSEFWRVAPFPIRYLHQPNRGPAAARNLGLTEAATQLVLYTDDDVIPHPELVLQHVRWHRQDPAPSVAVLGFVTWAPEVHATPFMRWYGEGGSLFGYRQFRHRREIDYRSFYTCNLSVKREFLQAFGKFDERFKIAAYEDIELGFRLSKTGLRLLYNPQAIGYHYQFFTFGDACRKKKKAAPARQLFLQTEAGKHLLEIQRQRDSRFIFRVARWMITWFGRLFESAPKLLDSNFPLPGFIYRSLLWFHAGRTYDVRELGEENLSHS